MIKEDTEILSLLNDAKSFEKGFEALVNKYKEPLYWHIRRMVHIHSDADDVLQNTFIKIFKAISKFRGDSKLYTWMYRIASNETITFLNKNRLKTTSDFDLTNSLKEDPYFNGDEIQLLLKQAIDTLPMKQKQIFIMRYYDKIKYAEMSSILDTSEGALKAGYHHAVKKVESFLKTNLINA